MEHSIQYTRWLPRAFDHVILIQNTLTKSGGGGGGGGGANHFVYAHAALSDSALFNASLVQ